jgi:hypothetical protein
MLCAKKKDMADFNLYHLKKTGQLIARLKAVNSTGAATFDADHAQGLKNTTYLSKGAKIVLTSNIWVKFQLFKEGKCLSTNLPRLHLTILHYWSLETSTIGGSNSNMVCQE